MGWLKGALASEAKLKKEATDFAEIIQKASVFNRITDYYSADIQLKNS